MNGMKYAWLLAFMALTGCSPAQPMSSQTEPVPEPDHWTAIPDEDVVFKRMHPAQAQKNTYVTWKRYENDKTKERVWRVLDRDISASAADAVVKLMDSATANLIPSDGIYACRYHENMPQYRLEFQKDGHQYSVISVSDCLHGAPYNVSVDGKLNVQMTGELGTAIENALRESGTDLKIGASNGLIMMTENVSIPGFDAEKQSSPILHYDQQFRSDGDFGAVLAHYEGLFGKIEMPEAACNQMKSPDCSDLTARYTLHPMDGLELTVPIQFNGGKVTSKLPPKEAWDILKKASESPVFTAWITAFPRETRLKITWSPEDNSQMVRGLAQYFDLPETIPCSSWSLTADGQPTVVYYVGLDSLWIEPGADLKPFFDKIIELKKEKKKNKYKAFQKSDKKTNLFVRLDGRPIAFVTKDGKTTIVE